MEAKRIKLSGGENGDGGSNIPIRTLCVSRVNADMCDALKSYFERFGTVNSVEIEQEDNADTHFALVEFKLAEAAAAVLSSIRMHRIDDCDVEVIAAKPWQQPDHILNALDDDCLRLIFKKLNQKDLTNVANVCVRFNEEAKSVFSTKFKKLIFTQSNTGDEIESALKTLGSLAQAIDITCEYYHSEYGISAINILPMIAQYCTSALKELTFRDFIFANQLQNIDVKFDLALSKLERLTLINCNLQNSSQNLVSACVNLKVLHIESCRQNLAWHKWPKFSKLEDIRFIDCPRLNDDFIDDIFKTNTKLTKISLIDEFCYRDNDYAKMLRVIVQNNPNLLELEFEWDFVLDIDFLEGIRCLGQLKSLKVLKLKLKTCLAAPLCSVLIDMASIEHVKFTEGRIDTNSIDAISKMKQLKVLELSDTIGLTDEHLIVLAKGLGSQLEKLELDSSTAVNLTTIGLKKMLPLATKLSLLTLKSATITIDTDDYKAMLNTVQKRQEKNSFSIELTGKGGQVGVNESVLVKNRDIFYIDENISPQFIAWNEFA